VGRRLRTGKLSHRPERCARIPPPEKGRWAEAFAATMDAMCLRDSRRSERRRRDEVTRGVRGAAVGAQSNSASVYFEPCGLEPCCGGDAQTLDRWTTGSIHSIMMKHRCPLIISMCVCELQPFSSTWDQHFLVRAHMPRSHTNADSNHLLVRAHMPRCTRYRTHAQTPTHTHTHTHTRAHAETL
jgi:hypothetical protein